MHAPGRMAAVVLNYRSAPTTINAVHALQASTRVPDEVIVVDNGSGDGSEQALIAALPTARVIQTGKNLGFSGGCNVGIAQAQRAGADTVVLVNSDAVVSPECLQRLEAALWEQPALGVVGPLIVSGDGLVESAGISYSMVTGRMRHLGFGRPGKSLSTRTVDGVSGCVMMIRRSTLERVGLLTEDYFFSFEDLDYCLRARSAGILTACVGDAVALHQGAHTIGKKSPRRVYFATRNHLLMAARAMPLPVVPSLLRGGTIAALNLAHALLTSEARLVPGVAAVVRGVRDHLRRVYGASEG